MQSITTHAYEANRPGVTWQKGGCNFFLSLEVPQSGDLFSSTGSTDEANGRCSLGQCPARHSDGYARAVWARVYPMTGLDAVSWLLTVSRVASDDLPDHFNKPSLGWQKSKSYAMVSPTPINSYPQASGRGSSSFFIHLYLLLRAL